MLIESEHSAPSTSFRVNPEYAEMAELIPGLYICGVSALTPENIQEHSISLIINATNEVPNLRSLGPIPRIKLWLEDTPKANIRQYFDVITDQIEAIIVGGGNVLVHCVAGVSRSASICLAFLMKFKCTSLRDAYYLMNSKRSLVRPNIGFWRQLIAYEQEIKESAASIRLIYDESQPEKYLPDVYMENSFFESTADGRRRRYSNGSLKYRPTLEPVLESVEATA